VTDGVHILFHFNIVHYTKRDVLYQEKSLVHLLVNDMKFNLKKNQLDAQFIFRIFRQTPLQVSGVFIAHHQEVYRTNTTIGTYCRTHKVYLLMMGYKYARNM
jgi:hypothetical protein